MDGTISEMVPTPEGATVSLSVKASLRELRRRLPLIAIVTGRSARHAREIVGLEDLIYVGNHGLERLERGRFSFMDEALPFIPLLEQLVTALRARVPAEGIFFEDKGGSFAVHYRLAREPDRACKDILDAIQDLAGEQVRVLLGKTVINVLPPVNLTKGTAVTSLVHDYGLGGAILIGDDVTDIDAFREARNLSMRQDFASISIAVVGPDSPSGLEGEVDFTVSSVSEVENFLSWLVEQVD